MAIPYEIRVYRSQNGDALIVGHQVRLFPELLVRLKTMDPAWEGCTGPEIVLPSSSKDAPRLTGFLGKLFGAIRPLRGVGPCVAIDAATGDRIEAGGIKELARKIGGDPRDLFKKQVRGLKVCVKGRKFWIIGVGTQEKP